MTSPQSLTSEREREREPGESEKGLGEKESTLAFHQAKRRICHKKPVSVLHVVVLCDRLVLIGGVYAYSRYPNPGFRKMSFDQGENLYFTRQKSTASMAEAVGKGLHRLRSCYNVTSSVLYHLSMNRKCKCRSAGIQEAAAADDKSFKCCQQFQFL